MTDTLDGYLSHEVTYFVYMGAKFLHGKGITIDSAEAKTFIMNKLNSIGSTRPPASALPPIVITAPTLAPVSISAPAATASGKCPALFGSGEKKGLPCGASSNPVCAPYCLRHKSNLGQQSSSQIQVVQTGPAPVSTTPSFIQSQQAASALNISVIPAISTPPPSNGVIKMPQPDGKSIITFNPFRGDTKYIIEETHGFVSPYVKSGERPILIGISKDGITYNQVTPKERAIAIMMGFTTNTGQEIDAKNMPQPSIIPASVGSLPVVQQDLVPASLSATLEIKRPAIPLPHPIDTPPLATPVLPTIPTAVSSVLPLIPVAALPVLPTAPIEMPKIPVTEQVKQEEVKPEVAPKVFEMPKLADIMRNFTPGDASVVRS